MSESIPNTAFALIVGAMKCGTTSLYAYLVEHPQICPARKKEPEFFSENQIHGVAVDRYEDLWDFDAATHKYAIEASTGYTKYPREKDVPEKMFNYGLKPKFIYVVRDPFERVVSHFHHITRKSTWRSVVRSSQVISTSNYFMQLERYAEYFPREDILIVDFDDLKANPRQTVENVYEFLGVSVNYLPQSFEVKNVATFRSPAEMALRHSKASFLFEKFPSPAKVLAKQLLRFASPPRRRALSVRERKYIHACLESDMMKLNEVYGVNVEKWGFRADVRASGAPPLSSGAVN